MPDFIDTFLVAAKVPLKDLDTYKAFLDYIQVNENTIQEITEERLEKYAKEFAEEVTNFRLGLYAPKFASVAANWGNSTRFINLIILTSLKKMLDHVSTMGLRRRKELKRN